MTAAAGQAVELLERALGYTRLSLGSVTDDLLGRATPCRAWDLGDLLTHLADGLDAFTEGAAGWVGYPAGPGPARPAARVAELRVAELRAKAGALLGAWSRPVPDHVDVGDHRLATATLARAAALETTVHGWDVAQTTGAAWPIPVALARDLLPVAQQLVAAADRGVRFGPARPSRPGEPDDVRLLRFLGRMPGPAVRQNPGHSGPQRRAAS